MNELKRKNRRLLILFGAIAIGMYLGAIYFTGTQ